MKRWLQGAALAVFALAVVAAVCAEDSYAAALSLYWEGRRFEAGDSIRDSQQTFQRSLAMTERLLVANPEHPDLQVLKAWNLFRLGRYAEAVVYAQTVLRQRQDIRILETMAESLYFLKKDEEALQAFVRYFSAAPEGDERLSSAYYYVGEIYYRMKKYEHADIALSMAVAMEPNMYYWWYRLGIIKEQLGQYRRAYETYKRSLDLRPQFEPAKEALERVKTKSSF